MERGHQLSGVSSPYKRKETSVHETVSFRRASTYFWWSESGKVVKHKINIIFEGKVWTEYKKQDINSESNTEITTKNWVAFISNRQQKKNYIEQPVNM